MGKLYGLLIFLLGKIKKKNIEDLFLGLVCTFKRFGIYFISGRGTIKFWCLSEEKNKSKSFIGAKRSFLDGFLKNKVTIN